jgi:hypothetical protein
MAKYTEFEWNLKLQSPATGSEVYEFRVYAEDDPFGTYAVTPQLTVSGGGTTGSFVGVNAVTAAYIGTTAVTKLYVGTTQVWPPV